MPQGAQTVCHCLHRRRCLLWYQIQRGGRCPDIRSVFISGTRAIPHNSGAKIPEPSSVMQSWVLFWELCIWATFSKCSTCSWNKARKKYSKVRKYEIYGCFVNCPLVYKHNNTVPWLHEHSGGQVEYTGKELPQTKVDMIFYKLNILDHAKYFLIPAVYRLTN